MEKINRSAGGIFAYIADETTDLGKVEQLSHVVRYVNQTMPTEPRVEERFLSYSAMKSTKGEDIANEVLRTLRDSGLDLAKLAGQGLDGAAANTGKVKGVKTRVLARYPMARFVHCSSHCLNLGVNDGNEIVSNVMRHVSGVSTFFLNSPMRVQALKNAALILHLPEVEQKALLLFCTTRFVQRFEAVARFYEQMPFVVKALEVMASESDHADVRNGADGHLSIILRFEFLFSLRMLVEVGKTLKKVAKGLQSPRLDLLEAVDMVNSEIAHYTRMLNGRSAFLNVWDDARKLGKTFGLGDNPEELPVSLRRKYKGRRDVQTFYREQVFDAYLECLCEHLKSRFGPHQREVFYLQCLIPLYHCRLIEHEEPVLKAIAIYEPLHKSGPEESRTELQMWVRRWREVSQTEGVDALPSTVKTALAQCDRSFFPVMHICLQAFATLPATTTEAERTFSALGRIKTPLRSTVGEDRLIALTHMTMNRDIPVDPMTIVDRFLAARPNRLALI